MEILRSLVLMSHFRCRSFKAWAKRLKEDSLLAFLSGFEEDDSPSFPSFYDFVSRFYKEEKRSIYLNANTLKIPTVNPKARMPSL